MNLTQKQDWANQAARNKAQYDIDLNAAEAEHGKKPQRKSRVLKTTAAKAEKDAPKAPKRPRHLHAYNFYYKEQFAIFTLEKKRPAKELAKDIGTKWKALPDEDKKKYFDMARVAKDE